MDDSKHMTPFWSELGLCIARCVSTIIDTAEDGYILSDNYFPYGEGEEEKEIGESDDEDYQESTTISLHFLNFIWNLKSLAYPNSVLGAFERIMPQNYLIPLGSRIFEVLADLFSCPPSSVRPVSPRLPIHIIIPTAGHTTDNPENTIDYFLMGD